VVFPLVAAALAGSAIVGAIGAKKAGDAQASAVAGNAALNERVAKSEARAVEVNGELDQRQAESEAYVVERNAQAEARFIDDTIVQETIATGREKFDLAVDRRAKLGRTKAALAAAGYSLAEGSALEVTQEVARRYAIEDVRMDQDLSVAVSSLRSRKSDVLSLAAYQAGYLRESGVLAQAFATVRAKDIRDNATLGTSLANSQANAIRTSATLTAVGTLLSGGANAYAKR
jgi:hypothetical protein